MEGHINNIGRKEVGQVMGLNCMGSCLQHDPGGGTQGLSCSPIFYTRAQLGGPHDLLPTWELAA